MIDSSNISPGIIAITMAGEGSRFILAGFNEPKYKILVQNKTLFEWSLSSLTSFRDNNWKFIFVVQKQHNAEKFITKICKRMNFNIEEIICISEITDGQASTAKIVADKYAADVSFGIFNIDTYISNQSLSHHDIPFEKDGWIPCFNGKGDMWSFVKVDNNLFASEVREKKRISNNASIGFYWFKSTKQYIEYYKKHFNKYGLENNERYIAPIYNSLIEDKKKITIKNLPENDVHILGTPEQVNYFDKYLENKYAK